MEKEKISAILGLLFLLVSFLAVSYFIQENAEYIEGLVSKPKVRDFAVVFTLVVIIGTVVAPISLLPIIPLATYAYGWFPTGILLVLGQLIGAVIAFLISRRWGLPLVTKLISLKEIEKYERMLPEGNVFWAIVLLRIAIPVDALSYVFGLFSKIRISTFTLATAIGLIPQSFALAYLGGLQFRYQAIAFVMFIAVILVGYGIDSRYRQPNKLKMLGSTK